MWTEQVLDSLSKDRTYHRDDLFELAQKEDGGLTDSAFRWGLYDLQQKRELFRIGYDEYGIDKAGVRPYYKPVYSEGAISLSEKLNAVFPTLDYVVFESVLLNEFLNHQIAQNAIYVQVQKDVSSYIFDTLQDDYNGQVIYRPNRKEFDRYWRKDCIVVLDLISQSPLSDDNPHEITLEKLLVDVVAEKSISAIYSLSEIPFIYENALRNYAIDERRIHRYAGRRGKAELIEKYLKG